MHDQKEGDIETNGHQQVQGHERQLRHFQLLQCGTKFCNVTTTLMMRLAQKEVTSGGRS